MQYEEDMQKADIKHNNHTCTIQQSTQIYNHSNYMYLQGYLCVTNSYNIYYMSINRLL